MRKQFSESKTFWKTVGLLHKNFRHCETDNFRRKILTPLLCIIFFDTRIFLKHWRNAHENFRHFETEYFWRKNVIPPIIYKVFRLPQTFWNIEVMPTNFFGTVRPKNFRRRNLILIFSSGNTFRNQKFSQKQQDSFTKRSALWDKLFSTENGDTLVCIKFFDTRYFPKHWGNAHEFFRHCETKNFRRNMATPLICINNFDTRIFLKLWRDVNENFRHCETEKFWRQNVIPTKMHKIFRLP